MNELNYLSSCREEKFSAVVQKNVKCISFRKFKLMDCSSQAYGLFLFMIFFLSVSRLFLHVVHQVPGFELLKENLMYENVNYQESWSKWPKMNS